LAAVAPATVVAVVAPAVVAVVAAVPDPDLAGDDVPQATKPMPRRTVKEAARVTFANCRIAGIRCYESIWMSFIPGICQVEER